MRLRSTVVAAISFVFFAASIAAPASAQAQVPTIGGFAIDRFNPSERGSEWFALDSLDMRGKVRPAIGIVGEFAYNELVLYNSDGSIRSSPVHEEWIIHPGASLVLLDRVRLGFDLPIVVDQTGHQGYVNGVRYPAVVGQAFGDLRLGVDLRLLGQYEDPFRLSLGVQVFLPTGDRASYMSDGEVRVLPRLQAAGDIAWFSYAANVGFEYRGLDEQFDGSGLGSEVLFGASAGVHLADRKVLIGPEVFGSTVVTKGDLFAGNRTPLEILFGTHFLFAPDWRGGVGIAPGLTRGFGEPLFRVLASIEWAPQPPPPPPPDRDQDGVIDDQDACPDEPGVKTDDPKTNGCPPPPAPPPPPPDRDHDGVIDDEDACPEVAGVKTDDPKTNGCPPDRDKDGIIDAEDACPDVPGLKTDDPKTNGCPDPDRDKDGIPNDDDACPDAPGPKNADPKKNGCPAAAVVGKRIVILEQVKFATGSAKILPASDAILNAVLTVLQGHTEIAHLSVEGHTDNVGAAAMNKDLSARRAAAVVSWLVAHGVDSKRLSSAGYGMEKPIDDNKTAEGRQNNRRVEFHIQDDAAPTE